jgi:steroid delta-isomerase-like uncharacterized protein
MMQKIVFALLIVFYSCSNSNHAALEKIAHDRIDFMSKHDPKGLSTLYTDNAEVASVGFPEPAIGPAGVIDKYTRYFKSTPDLSYKVTNTVFGDNSVVVEYTCEGTLQGLEEGVPAYMHGKKYSLVNSTRMDVENGKIVREMTYFDQVSFLRQMSFFEQPCK